MIFMLKFNLQFRHLLIYKPSARNKQLCSIIWENHFLSPIALKKITGTWKCVWQAKLIFHKSIFSSLDCRSRYIFEMLRLNNMKVLLEKLYMNNKLKIHKSSLIIHFPIIGFRQCLIKKKNTFNRFRKYTIFFIVRKWPNLKGGWLGRRGLHIFTRNRVNLIFRPSEINNARPFPSSAVPFPLSAVHA